VTNPDTPLPPWADLLIADLDDADRAAEQLTSGLSEDDLNWHPAAGAWSVGQCLEHLAITNEVYLPPISASFSAQPDSVVQEITPGWFARWFMQNFIEPSPKTKRARAPGKIVPSQRVALSVVQRFRQGNDAVREMIHRAASHDVNHLRFKNPFVPLLRFTVGSGFLIITRHQKRHLLQAERVRQSAEFPR